MLKENNLNNNAGFKVPDNYFENFEEKYTGLYSNKHSLPQETGFKVPVNYFENLGEQIELKLKHKPKVVSLKRIIYYPLSGIAAVVLLLLLLKNTVFSGQATLDKISSDEVEQYINTNYLSFFYQDEDYLNDIENIDENDILENPISEKELIKYLNESFDPYIGDITINE